jgi:hypothetical protein
MIDPDRIELMTLPGLGEMVWIRPADLPRTQPLTVVDHLLPDGEAIDVDFTDLARSFPAESDPTEHVKRPGIVSALVGALTRGWRRPDPDHQRLQAIVQEAYDRQRAAARAAYAAWEQRDAAVADADDDDEILLNR